MFTSDFNNHLRNNAFTAIEKVAHAPLTTLFFLLTNLNPNFTNNGISILVIESVFGHGYCLHVILSTFDVIRMDMLCEMLFGSARFDDDEKITKNKYRWFCPG